MNKRMAYVSGALSDVPEEERSTLRKFYEGVGKRLTLNGFFPYIPHLHSDPIRHPNLTPTEVDEIDRLAVCKSWLAVVCGAYPAFGPGIELELAHHAHTPVILLLPKKRISRLFKGGPAVIHTIEYDTHAQALVKLDMYLPAFKNWWSSRKLPKPLGL